MRADRFLDTNILLYAFATDPARSPAAEQLIAEGGCISVQVLNEFANVCQRKLSLDWSEIRARLGVVRRLLGEPTPLTISTHVRAIEFAEQSQLSLYDALIVAAATEAGCTSVETEDLQHGRSFGRVMINNPFKQNP
ncbi:MAG: PIN domain-containing protein [Hyphomonadaceae bacterium]|nr:PIN domain-containing protein [Hyphomonadaceae bacterium]